MVWHGSAWHGMAMVFVACFGMACPLSKSHPKLGSCMAWHVNGPTCACGVKGQRLKTCEPPPLQQSATLPHDSHERAHPQFCIAAHLLARDIRILSRRLSGMGRLLLGRFRQVRRALLGCMGWVSGKGAGMWDGQMALLATAAACAVRSLAAWVGGWVARVQACEMGRCAVHSMAAGKA